MARLAGSTGVERKNNPMPKKSLNSLLGNNKKSTTIPKVEKKVEDIKELDEVNDLDEIPSQQPINNNNNVTEISFQELKDLFGFGFIETEYRQMYKRYTDLQNNYPLRTEMHKEALLTYVKYAFKRDKAISDDDMDAADKWGKLAAKQATDAKINPSQLSAADLSDGISNFSKISEAIEGKQDIISILPHFKQKPQDVVDYTIWQYVNYIRRLQNLPEVQYKDIYAFMDSAYTKNKNDLTFLVKEKNGHYDNDNNDGE